MRLVLRGVSPKNIHLLIVDGHDSHVALETIQEARMLGINLLTLLVHTLHKLQPFDVSIFPPFKIFFKSKRATWMAKYPNIEIKRQNWMNLATSPYKKH